ncbi:MAG: DUF4142 domain-containing protein [Bacteroidota bacterium]
MKTTIYSIAIFAAALSLASCGPKKDDSKKEAEAQNEQKFDDSRIEGDTEFAVNAADAGMLEVRLGELAQKNAYSAQVKSFAKMMVTEHEKANEELKGGANQKGISLPEYLSTHSQSKYDDLSKKTGKEFDDAYTEAMVKAHKEALDLFQKEAADGKDADLKAWATAKVSVIEHHLDMAKQTEEAVDKMSK